MFQKKTTTSTFDRDVSLNLRDTHTHLIEIEMMMTARIQIIQKIIKFSKKKTYLMLPSDFSFHATSSSLIISFDFFLERNSTSKRLVPQQCV